MAKTRQNVKEKLKPPEACDLLAWYDRHGRKLPWRSHNGRGASVYHTWIAEIMLQQTTVATVIPYYERFMARWPTIEALAKAQEQDVLKEWAGLGYYSRARNLLKCAQIVAKDFKGRFPKEVTELKKLPGIGDYTANAIRAIALDLPANVVDGNVERVVSRLFAYGKPLNRPGHKKDIQTLAAGIVPEKRPGDYAQALMDLGATICTPRQPQCPQCPWQSSCLAFQRGEATGFPVRVKKEKIPQRFATCLVMRNAKGAYFLAQRPSAGLLGGLWEFPSTEWEKDTPPSTPDALRTLGVRQKDVRTLAKPVIHVFSHFKLIVTVMLYTRKTLPARFSRKGRWFLPETFPPLSTLTKKIHAATGKDTGAARKSG